MKKVYLVVNIRTDYTAKETYTDIVHVCADEDLAVEKSNEYVNDIIHEALRGSHDEYVWVEAQKDSVTGKYYSKDELLRGRCYLGLALDDRIVKTYTIRIEEHELKED